jgi:copper oxidase (laccase) domain-containing protein
MLDNSLNRSNAEPTTERLITQPDRYETIDRLNEQSFMTHGGGSLQVLQSLHSAGTPRDLLPAEYVSSEDSEVIAGAKKIGRVMLAGNMSPLHEYGPAELTPEQRIEDAKKNIERFLNLNDIDRNNVRILRPERDYDTPLNVVDLDDTDLAPDDTGLLRPDRAADMIYTYNSETILAARPADCPIVYVSAETPKGEVTVLLHLAWMGVANGYVQQAKKELDMLKVDWSTAQIQITPGGHAETYAFKHFDKFNPVEKYPESAGMFVDFQPASTIEGKMSYSFGIDVAAEVYEQITHSWSIDPHNIFADTSNTTAPQSGYSSHSRSFKKYNVHGENSRDLVLARRIVDIPTA